MLVCLGVTCEEFPCAVLLPPGRPTWGFGASHQPPAVAALTASLTAMGYFPTTHAVFGAMADKDLAPMLARIGPLVDRWYFTDLPTPRASSAQALLASWQAQNKRAQATATTYADPLQALHAAQAAADPADRIVVFGSFFTVGGILKEGVPRLQAKHMST